MNRSTDASMTIGELARAAGVPTSTIRFYERRGLLKPDARTRANYRTYAPQSAERLRFIRAAQSVGLSLDDVVALLKLTFSDATVCDPILALGRNRLAHIRARIKDLRRVERGLTRALQACCRGERGDLCGELSRLHGKRCACTPPSCNPACATAS